MIRPEYMIFIFIVGVTMIAIGLFSLRKNANEEDESFEEKYPEDNADNKEDEMPEALKNEQNEFDSAQTNPLRLKQEIDRKNNLYGSEIFSIRIENNTDEQIELELLNLDKKDSRYSFSTDYDYNKILKYFTTKSKIVNLTRVQFNEDGCDRIQNLKTNFILKSATPFNPCYTEFLFNVFHAFSICQFQSYLVDFCGDYRFGIFDDLSFTLKPKQKISITLFMSDTVSFKEKPNKYHLDSLRSILSVKNTSNEKKRFIFNNQSFYDSIKENNDLKVEVLFGGINYQSILDSYDKHPLMLSKLKLYFEDINSKSEIKINNKVSKIGDYYSINQFQTNIVEIPCGVHGNLCDIYDLEVELEPNTEILIALY